jgi:hypothetical protein
MTMPLLAGTLILASRPWGSAPVAQPGIAGDQGFTLAWGVQHTSPAFEGGSRTYVTAIGVAPGHAPVAVVIPAGTAVDVPGGGSDIVAQALQSPGLLVAVVQAALDRRVDHYIESTETDVMALVDRLGGITVQVQEAFPWGNDVLGPGPERLFGGAALAYLEAGSTSVVEGGLGEEGSEPGGGTGEEGSEEEAVIGDDTAGRWQDVLWGLFSASRESDRWAGLIGESDEQDASKLLARAAGAVVTELPTVPSEDGRILLDTQAIAELVRTSFPAPTEELIRVVVFNGNGRTGQGLDIGAILAPAGYRVVAAQNAETFEVEETEIIAATEGLLPRAEEVRTLLGVGKVYVGPQPTGIGDIVIVAGKDFTGA